MADIFSKEKRSKIMSNIRSQDTSLERLVFSFLRREGVYFQRHYSRVAGKPDIALPRKKIAVFIDGDFWHGWRFEQNKHRLPEGYWVQKIENNIKRDQKNRRALRRAGWRVLRIWEHDVRRQPQKTLEKIKVFLESSKS